MTLRRAPSVSFAGLPGYCAPTNWQDGKNCDTTRRRGIFDIGTFGDLAMCTAKCRECSACQFISFSQRYNDCSWYRSCDMGRLSSKHSTAHRTYRVRTANGSLVDSTSSSSLMTELEPSWFERPRDNLFFHELSASHVYLHTRLPDFTASRTAKKLPGGQLALLNVWRERILAAPGTAETGRRYSSCAVVGSSSILLDAEHGAAIDAHDAVFRANKAPISGYERHVGSRTTMRIWGSQPLPENYTQWRHTKETIVLHCQPVPWVSSCWHEISVGAARPRISPFAWEELLLSVYDGDDATMRNVLKYPSTGAMAVWTALARCDSPPTVYGFGGACARKGTEARAGRRGHQHRQAASASKEPLTYYPNGALTKKGVKGFWGYHNYVEEWAWLRRLHNRRLIRLVSAACAT
jgi:hypothetical protein